MNKPYLNFRLVSYDSFPVLGPYVMEDLTYTDIGAVVTGLTVTVALWKKAIVIRFGFKKTVK